MSEVIEMSHAAPAPPVRVETRTDDVVAIVLDRAESRVNLIDDAFLDGMSRALDEVEQLRPRGMILVSGKPAHFIAGADVNLIAALDEAGDAARRAEQGQRLLDRIEDLPFRTVAAIEGACVGGGLETALACEFLVAAEHKSTKLGLPEVRLGILPGFGGTFRLPRRVGIQAALPLILSGRLLDARRAGKIGLVDRVTVPEYLEAVAIEVAGGQATPRHRAPWRQKASDFLLGRTAPGKALLRSMTDKQLAKQTGGHYPAPPEILARVLGGYGAKRESALRDEARSFGHLAVTPQAKSLIFLYQGNEDLGRYAWSGKPASPDTTSSRSVVVGAGTMGGGIAGTLAGAGLEVRLRDVSVESLRIGLAGAAAPLNRRVKKRRMKPRERDQLMARISPTTDETGATRADFVIEAVPEILELKQQVFRELEQLLPDHAFLATNTSSLPIDAIAAGIDNPERLVGIHFFNPVHRMPLVEVIPGSRTRASVLNAAVGLVRRLKKSPIVVADRPGFLVNRLLLPYLNEAAHAVEEGWPIPAIDSAMLRFGMPMGPLRVLDEVGLDVAAKVSGVLHDAFGERAKPAGVMERLLAAGALGTKAGRGFWKGEGKTRGANEADLGALPIAPAPSDSEIVDRMLCGMINEAARCLAEGVVREPEHLDLGTVLGAGFPPFYGGVRRYAQTLGENVVRQRLERLTERYGERFTPASSLGELF